MSTKIIQDRLDSYQCNTAIEEEQALREITQEVALAALTRTDFFKYASFHGGTCLRIFYGINRFSEDFDFLLKEPDHDFSLDSYLKSLSIELDAYGYKLETTDRTKADSAVKKAFIKDNSIGKVLQLSHLRADRSMRKIRIKLEIDTNPPEGSNYEIKYLDFPFVSSVTIQDLPSLFAGKIHALLCREYTKGRDWYDFIWYTSRGVGINYQFLASALKQQGPWRGQELKICKEWCIRTLRDKICSLDWQEAKNDIRRFVRQNELSSLELWNRELFLDRLDKYASKVK
ncbi:MAG: nucleotidyl transferase AbiEii/AbiGii toxin family protein [Sedimentisphaerales bacterium]|nr:nucleotidyl transferase AbiEii/AbiGii toxin family protein [Sedimentisphaerales bacterium]